MSTHDKALTLYAHYLAGRFPAECPVEADYTTSRGGTAAPASVVEVLAARALGAQDRQRSPETLSAACQVALDVAEMLAPLPAQSAPERTHGIIGTRRGTEPPVVRGDVTSTI